MQVIACLSQKGGVGKSTLSRLIAVSFAASKWRVKIADFNLKQKTSIDWAAMRLDRGFEPPVAAEAADNVRQVLLQRDLYDLMVFDGRPDSEPTSLDIARAADLVICPAGVTADDLRPQIRFANELRAKGVHRDGIWFAINKSIDSLLAVAEARETIESHGYGVFKTDVPMRTGYQIAQNSGRALNETTFPSLNERADALASEVFKALNKATKELAK